MKDEKTRFGLALECGNIEVRCPLLLRAISFRVGKHKGGRTVFI